MDRNAAELSVEVYPLPQRRLKLKEKAGVFTAA
jgi:hypothetical protein